MSDKPVPPYYAVIFSSVRTDNDDGYEETARQMRELAQQQPGYLGFETASEESREIAISYWKDLANIRAWKQVTDHISAQKRGREKWYKSYTTRIATVERHYSFEKAEE